MSKRAISTTNFAKIYPDFSDFFNACPDIDPIIPGEGPTPAAVVKVVASQSFSTAAARMVCDRISEQANALYEGQTWDLPYESLRSCGLSRAKARSIQLFAEEYSDNSSRIDSWVNLSSDDLFAEVTSFTGMGEWTAAILAIFHFGHEDVFPQNDNSLRKALRKLHNKHPGSILDPADCSPIRSYLALTLWRALDEGRL